jgi:hypothetical protein
MLKIIFFIHFVHVGKIHTLKMYLLRSAMNMQCSEMHRLNMELDLQSLFVQSCTHWLSSRNPTPRIWALLVSQDRRHFFMTPCIDASFTGHMYEYKCAVAKPSM